MDNLLKTLGVIYLLMQILDKYLDIRKKVQESKAKAEDKE